jgi:uncharacterized UBP type Zn finger protein
MPAEQLDGLVAAVLSSMSSAQRSEVKAWEEEITSCTHTTNLVQPEPKKLEAEGTFSVKGAMSCHIREIVTDSGALCSGLAKCAHEGCEFNSNLWLCLVCGSLGCGRQQFGGGGGNGHGLLHTQETGHAVAVKLGTIEPDGSAGEWRTTAPSGVGGWARHTLTLSATEGLTHSRFFVDQMCTATPATTRGWTLTCPSIWPPSGSMWPTFARPRRA